MKLFQNTQEFSYPWEQVTAANWRKYPNEVSTHVVAVDVLRRELDPSGTKLTSERLITCKQSIPKWLTMMIGTSNVSYVREVSVVDLNTKTLTLRSCNLTCMRLLKVCETVKYMPHHSDLGKTLFQQEAQITAYATIATLCNKIEEWSVKRFGENASKGRQGFESVLKILSENWDQRDKIVNELTLKVVDTVDEIRSTTDTLFKETELKSTSLISRHIKEIQRAFKLNN
ncbi:LANO_0G08174g1_1 [Lachancea nothofagi CBS 11611]|uniref:LANO_0G08174g1_1 n=1 Tax=Lachancea nothofagi CBS 11611 TaxID=1266666 RepID=A0A1G4KHZ8_9SACH|nr:LANO_0G08174g1_1 [Lachancea nothofagi CBS 11611]